MRSKASRDPIAQLVKPCKTDQLVAALQACGFSAASYLAANPDVTPRTPEAGLLHFLQHGYREMRPGYGGALLQGLAELAQCPIGNRAYASALLGGVYSGQIRTQENARRMWSLSDPTLIDRIREIGGTPYFIVGDSHSHLHARTSVLADGSWLAPLPVLCTAGSAIGLSNPQSRSKYGPRLLAWAKAAAPLVARRVPVFLKFGQVDIEFVWTFRRIRQRERRFSLESYKRFAAESVSAYGAFMDQLCAILDRAQLRILSVFPPALSDAAWSEGYVNGHIGTMEGETDLNKLAASVKALEIPGLATRILMHDAYNRELQRMCRARGLRYVDDFVAFLDLSGLTDARFISYSKGSDHHLDYAPTGTPIVQMLERELLA